MTRLQTLIIQKKKEKKKEMEIEVKNCINSLLSKNFPPCRKNTICFNFRNSNSTKNHFVFLFLIF